MGVTVEASKTGSNPYRFLFYFGVGFAMFGGIAALISIVAAIDIRQPFALIIGSLISIVFVFGGMLCAIIAHRKLHSKDEIMRSGRQFVGKIFALEPDYSMLVNGEPLIRLVVRYRDNGEIRQVKMTTGESDSSLFPRGATVSFCVYRGQAAYVSGSISSRHLDNEEDLLNPDFDPTGERSSEAMSCPNCGATVSVPRGMSRICPYCSTKLSLS